MTRTRRWLALALVLALCLGLTACGGGSGKPYTAKQLAGEWWVAGDPGYNRPWITFYENGTCLAHYSRDAATFTILSDNTLQIIENRDGSMDICHIDSLDKDTLVLDGKAYSHTRPQ